MALSEMLCLVESIPANVTHPQLCVTLFERTSGKSACLQLERMVSLWKDACVTRREPAEVDCGSVGGFLCLGFTFPNQPSDKEKEARYKHGAVHARAPADQRRDPEWLEKRMPVPSPTLSWRPGSQPHVFIARHGVEALSGFTRGEREHVHGEHRRRIDGFRNFEPRKVKATIGRSLGRKFRTIP